MIKAQSLPAICRLFHLFLGLALWLQPGSAPAFVPREEPAINTYDTSFIRKFLQPGQYMTPAEIKPGMVGFGLTVFQGTKIERFNVKVIGVIKKALNGRDAILVRFSGAALGNNNVIKGMSGSPVFIDGKLIGAVSFGYEFSKEPIGGITPIVDMLDAMAPAAGSPGGNRIDKAWLPFPPAEGQGKAPVSGPAQKMVPLLSPVSLSGFSPRAEHFLSEYFKKFGLSAAGGGGAAAAALDRQSASSLVPGSAVSVLLTTGDFTTSATGTVTARFGNKILAFGHPFMQAGTVEFPMATAFVHEVLPSLFVSAKVASPGSVVGSVLADRPWSIGGQTGVASKMIPASFTVQDETRRIKRTFRVEVVNHPDLTPELLASCAMSAIDATHQSSGPYVARVESRIEADGISPIVRTDMFSTNFIAHALSDLGARLRFISDPVGAYLLRSTAQICDNDFQQASIKSVSMSIFLKDGRETAQIEKVYLDKAEAAPGETVKVNCLLKPYSGKPLVESLSFRVPKDMPEGNMLIGVASGDEINSVRKRLGIVDPAADSLEQVAERIQQKESGDSISLIAALPEQTLLLRGKRLESPPAHWSKIFYSNRHTKWPALVKGEIRARKRTRWLVDGSHLITVEIKNPDRALANAAPYLVAPPAADDSILTTEAARKASEAYRKNQGAASVQTAGAPAAPAEKAADKAADKPAEKPAATATPAPPSSASEYPHMRGLSTWRIDSLEDFSRGKLSSVVVDSLERLQPAFQETASKTLAGEMQIWSATRARGCLWFATGDRIWKWKGGDASPEPVAALDSVVIPAMVADASGTVYAAAVPGGQIYAIDQSDKPRKFFRTEEPIVTSLALDDKGSLYAGVAGSGRVYRVDASGQGKVIFESEPAHVTSLFYSRADGKLYIGTGERGCVYTVDALGAVAAVHQPAAHLVTGIARDRAGHLYIATAGPGLLLRLSSNGQEETLAASEAFYTLAYDPLTDRIFSGDAEGDITEARLEPLTGAPYFYPVSKTGEEAVVALVTGDDSSLYAFTSNMAGIKSFSMRPSAQATYMSPVKDTGGESRFSRLRLSGPYLESESELASAIKVETRTGSVASADSTWSPWQEAVFSDGSFQIVSPGGRFIQYRLTWKTEGAPADARPPMLVSRVDVSYMAGDQPPKFAQVSLKSGTFLSGKKDINITGSDPDLDNLLLTIELSQPPFDKWTALATDLRSKRTASKPARPAASGSERKQDGAGKGDEGPGAAGITPETGVKPGVENDGQPGDKDKSQPPADAPTAGESGNQKGRAGKKAGAGSDPPAAPKRAGSREGPLRAGGKGGAGTASRLPASTAAESGGAAETFTYSLDTTKHKDGQYLLRFTLDDRLSSPGESRQTSGLAAVTIDNTAPDIDYLGLTRKDEGELDFRVRVSDKLAAITNVTYRINDGDPFTMYAADGFADGRKVVFAARGVKARAGADKVEVRAVDAAGNSAARTFELK